MVRSQPFFLDVSGSSRFCIFHPAGESDRRGAVVYLHPFAEEMNKSRRMAALQSRALANAGFDVLQIDLYGCGDSSGDFEEATLGAWVQDALSAVAFLRGRTTAPMWFWGLRTGALVASEAAARLSESSSLLLWNPVLSGKQYLQQFLRLRSAALMLSGDTTGAVAETRREFESGQSVEIAGYRLSAVLAAELEQSILHPGANAQTVVLLDTSMRVEQSIRPGLQNAIRKWVSSGCTVRAVAVSGPSFWQTTEVEDAPALIEVTVANVLAAS